MKEITHDFQKKIDYNLQLIRRGELFKMTIPIARLRKIDSFKTSKALEYFKTRKMGDE